MCYDTLQKSDSYTLTYSEDQSLDNSYDFAIFNQHLAVNNWMTEEIIKNFGKPTFCVVTEVSFSENPIAGIPTYFSHYIVLDPTITETDKVHAFCRPIEDFDLSSNLYVETDINNPKIFSFGFATFGKEWNKIIELVQKDYDKATIHFNIPPATYVPYGDHCEGVKYIIQECNKILKPGIDFKLTQDIYSKDELIKICSQQTINCFFYNRQHMSPSGLSAVTDQAISSGRPLFITSDNTFRHIHKYINFYPNLGIKEAIQQTQEGVLRMRNDWSSSNFVKKFESILH